MGAATATVRSPADQTTFHKPRDPRASPVHRLLEEHFDAFERVYAERYQKRYGFWRPVIRKAVEAFQGCGDLKEGFARAWCPACGASFFVALSCKQRCICASCHQKRTLLTGIHISETVCEAVAHRQFVFTSKTMSNVEWLPKRFRRYFLFNRDLLRKLPNLAWACVREVYTELLGREDLKPGMVSCIQTFGRLSHWNPHTHCLVTEGAFTDEGTFIPLPEMLDTEPFLKHWESKIFDLLLAEELITQEVIDQLRSWRHSGFSVDHSVRLQAGDTKGIERLAQYMARCPFSLERVISVNDLGKVVYRAEKAAVHRYPLFGDAKLSPGVLRNFEVFDPLDFIAELTQHIPDGGMQLVRYMGWYSNRVRGMRAKKAEAKRIREECVKDASLEGDEDDESVRQGLKAARMCWAALIQRVYEVDPLKCHKCGTQMKIISFIERKDQPQVVKKILKHCGLWNQTPSRAPPVVSLSNGPQNPNGSELLLPEVEFVPIDEFLATF